MPEKEGSDEKKDAKSVVNRKQKQMMNQEQLDLSSVAESFGGQIIGEPVELDEDAGVVSLPLLTIGALTAAGIIGTDSYQKLRGKKGILPDMTPVVKGVGDTYNKVKDNILQIKKRMGSKNDQDTGGPTGGTKDRTKVYTPPKKELKKIKKQLDQNTYQRTQDRFFNNNNNNKNDKENKTLSNIVKIGGSGAAGATITNILKKDQTQKQNKKISNITKTKTKTGKDGKLPSIKFPGTAHIVGRRSNPQ